MPLTASFQFFSLGVRSTPAAPKAKSMPAADILGAKQLSAIMVSYGQDKNFNAACKKEAVENHIAFDIQQLTLNAKI